MTTRGAHDPAGAPAGAGLDAALPYLLLAPAVLIALAVLIYPLWDGIRASTQFYRYGKPLRDVGFGNYIQLWTDPQFLNSLWVTVKLRHARRSRSRRCSASGWRCSARANFEASACSAPC